MSLEIVCDRPALAGKYIDTQLESEPRVLSDLVDRRILCNTDTQWSRSYSFHMASEVGPAGEFNGVFLVTSEIQELENGTFAVSRLGIRSEHEDLDKATRALIHGAGDAELNGSLPQVPMD